MGRDLLRAAAGVALVALFTGSASASFAAAPEETRAPISVGYEDGRYLVVLDEAPAATYGGGERGLAPTIPDEGQKLDASSPDVQAYSEHLETRQQDVASEAGVEPDGNLTITLNAFTANLTAAQAAELARANGVQAVVADEIRHPAAVASTEFLGLTGPGGVWEAVGGAEQAGAGTVVGVVDTGISPENPSFAGDPLGTDPSAGEPYLDGNAVTYAKRDGTLFASARVAGEEWSNDAYSTKLVGAKFFAAGAARAGYTFTDDYLSPRDADGHGSHTAGTAAGNHDVPASVEGVDFGLISGVAPGAKIAAYKACYAGPDPLVTSDDVCSTTDLLAAIDAATKDGVDVINYSISGSGTSTYTIEDDAFMNAAAAGVFIAVSAGNDGPAGESVDHGSPWYTSVAASTIPTYEGTVELPITDPYDPAKPWLAAGASVSVPFGEQVTAPVVYAGDAAAANYPDGRPVLAEQAEQCFLDALDPGAVADRIVVCDRGTNARAEKSQAVEAAGGVGMILLNKTPGSLDNDFHSVPTVHIQSTYRDALLAYVRPADLAKTATLHSANITGIETPTPAIAGFSSRGPMPAAGSDILKPDIAAPGVAILAPVNDAADGSPDYGFLSGTSMSSPHVAGLAALYLGERPSASPAEIKSAMMTTAYDTVAEDGSTVTDPFAQGAGHVDATRFFDPGLVYDNGIADWRAYLQGKGLRDDGVEPIDGSDLNLASISIGSLSGPQTVTRTVRATTAGTYSASAFVEGVDVIITPSTFTLVEGATQQFSVVFDKTTAEVEQWATGFLTLSGPTTVRSPIAVFPVTADAPQEVAGEGIAGSVPVAITPGLTGQLPLTLSGLAPRVLQTEAAEPNGDPVEGHSGDESTGDTQGTSYYLLDVPEGTRILDVDLDSSDDTGSDLDLFVYRVESPEVWRVAEDWTSATGAADEAVRLHDPTPGTYLVEADVYSFTAPFTWDLTTAVVGEGGEGSLTAAPNPLPVIENTPTTFGVAWAGLQPDTEYLGLVQYGDSAVRTVVSVDAGTAGPANTAAPTITGTPEVGRTLTATPGTWDPAEVTIAYQWLRDDVPIDGATTETHQVGAADAGTTLTVRVTATQEGSINAGASVSAGVFVKHTSTTSVRPNRYLGTSSQKWSVTISVTPSGGDAASGPVTAWVNAKKYTGTLANGTATIDLGTQERSVYVVTASYPGSGTVEASTGISGFLVYR